LSEPFEREEKRSDAVDSTPSIQWSSGASAGGTGAACGVDGASVEVVRHADEEHDGQRQQNKPMAKTATKTNAGPMCSIPKKE